MADDPEEVKATILGVPVAVKGVNMLVVVLLAVALAGAGFLLWEQMSMTTEIHHEQTIRQTTEHNGIAESLKGMQKANESIGELIDEQNYIILSDEKERKAIKEKLGRPPSLSKKLRSE